MIVPAWLLTVLFLCIGLAFIAGVYFGYECRDRR